MTDYGAIPRRYRGVEFRSTLEADWAATLDALDLDWEYEPTTFTLPSGQRYLPDFHLPQIGTWIEVKGTGVPRVEKARELAGMLTCHCSGRNCECEWYGGQVVLIGHPSGRADFKRFGTLDWHDALNGNALLGKCKHCGKHSWVRPRIALSCRHCRPHERTGCDFDHLANSGEIDFRRADRIEGFDF